MLCLRGTKCSFFLLSTFKAHQCFLCTECLLELENANKLTQTKHITVDEKSKLTSIWINSNHQ